MDDVILVIDDELDVVKLIEYNLKDAGFKTLSALDGESGLQMARDHKPDLIILDLMLPGVDGKDVCKELKKDKLQKATGTADFTIFKLFLWYFLKLREMPNSGLN